MRGEMRAFEARWAGGSPASQSRLARRGGGWGVGTGPLGHPNHRRGAEGARSGRGSAPVPLQPRTAPSSAAALSTAPSGAVGGFSRTRVSSSSSSSSFFKAKTWGEKDEWSFHALSHGALLTCPPAGGLCLSAQVITPSGFCPHPFSAQRCANTFFFFFLVFPLFVFPRP